MSDTTQKVGGGAINEKQRKFQEDDSRSGPEKEFKTFNPNSRSHLLHAIEGLDRYPAYLNRWSEDDITLLEESLENQLKKVRQQKEAIQGKRTSLKTVVENLCKKEPEWLEFLTPPKSWEELKSNILDERIAEAVFRSRWFRRSQKQSSAVGVQDVVDGSEKVEIDAGNLEPVMDEEMFDVYSFPLLAPSFCLKLRSYFRRVIQELEEYKDESSLRRGFQDLDNLGLSWLNSLLLHLIVRPISNHLYSETELKGGDLDWRQGYIAAYSADPTATKPRQRLVPHTDDSEITLNVGIGEEFSGGLLNFWGLRGTTEAGRLVGQYEPVIGRALIHSGRHFHEVTEITSGNRFAYILWARSWAAVRSTICPCCWLNRRDDGSCICGSKWN
ncbi:MAG: hypothetical protein SGBAC_003847 [Bacillariaceae sp.]